MRHSPFSIRARESTIALWHADCSIPTMCTFILLSAYILLCLTDVRNIK